MLTAPIIVPFSFMGKVLSSIMILAAVNVSKSLYLNTDAVIGEIYSELGVEIDTNPVTPMGFQAASLRE